MYDRIPIRQVAFSRRLSEYWVHSFGSPYFDGVDLAFFQPVSFFDVWRVTTPPLLARRLLRRGSAPGPTLAVGVACETSGVELLERGRFFPRFFVGTLLPNLD